MKNVKINLTDYKIELEEIEKELKILPPGILKKRIYKRGTFYYHWANGKEIGITRDKNRIKQLARKIYVLTRQKQLKNNATKPVNKFDHRTPKELIDSLPTAYRDLPENYFFHSSIENWVAKLYRKNTYPQEVNGYFSKKGVEFRSKSELIIANLLEEYNIPYHHDVAMKLGEKTKFPDFIIKNPFTGKTIIWEHFGSLNQDKYAENMIEKMELYLSQGYIPFETIIYTFESDIKAKQRLEYLIENIIL